MKIENEIFPLLENWIQFDGEFSLSLWCESKIRERFKRVRHKSMKRADELLSLLWLWTSSHWLSSGYKLLEHARRVFRSWCALPTVIGILLSYVLKRTCFTCMFVGYDKKSYKQISSRCTNHLFPVSYESARAKITYDNLNKVYLQYLLLDDKWKF